MDLCDDCEMYGECDGMEQPCPEMERHIASADAYHDAVIHGDI